MHDNWISQEQQRRQRAYHFLFFSFFVPTCIVLALFILPAFAHAEDSVFSWLPNSETDLAGYKIHYGPAPGEYTTVVDTGLPETNAEGSVVYAIPDTPTEQTYYAATAYDTAGTESAFSNEISNNSPPSAPGGFTRVTVTTIVTVE